MPATTASEELQTLAEKARRWRLAGDHHGGYHTDFPLVGYCFDNAYVAYHLFEERGFSPSLIEGTTSRVADDLIQHEGSLDGIETTDELGGLIHYWLEVTTGDETWMVDIASDTWDNLGECLVVSTLPDDYFVFEDSYEEGESLIQNVTLKGGRCRYCGDQRFTEGGCPDCHHLDESDAH